jgi:tripartite ATP-independent transporter DctP family solute receptor
MTVSLTRRHLLAGTAATTGLLAAPAVHAERVKKIRYAHSAPLAHGWHLWGVRFKTTLEAHTNNKMLVTIFPNAQLGTERDIAQAVRLGSVEMASVGVALMNWVPEVSITDAPFLFPTRARATAALDGALGAELAKRCKAQGFELVGWSDLGYRAMTNNKHQIQTASDMHDLKMRVPDSKSYIAMMKALGSAVVTVDLSELYLALSQGVADGQETPAPVIRTNKYYEVQKYVARTNHVLTNSYGIYNAGQFDALTPDEQAAVRFAAADATTYLRGVTAKDEEDTFSFLQDKGMQVNLTPDIASFQEACKSVWTDSPDLFRPDLIKLAQQGA